ncbi:hypothetical protein HOD88_02945 [archaeon]|jgi:hypothetical protein|nr:hypothetical protein [archaeon]
MNLIKNAIDGKADDFAHIQFQRFSKGEFRNRAIIKAKRTKDKFTINTSFEFANELVKLTAEELGQDKTKVVGAIVSTTDLDDLIEFKEKKQFQGVKRYLLDTEMSGEQILDLLKKFPKNFFGLTFEGKISKLKIKPKAPKAGKPGKGDEKPKADFCKLITTNKEWGESFVFENPNFKKAEIYHTFFVEKMIMPEGEEDYSKIRELAKRQGRIIRFAEIDEVESEKEYSFTA